MTVTTEKVSHREHQLPSGWRLTKLGDVIVEAKAGFACGERDESGVVQLRMNNVDTRGNFVWNEFIRVPTGAAEINEYRLMPGDVLFNNTNSTELVGKTALFPGHSEPVVYSNHFTRLRTEGDRLAAAYLSLWLNYEWQRGTFARICNRWIGQAAVKTDKLRALRIPLPPLAEQKRIAGIVQEQLAAVERARLAAQSRLAASQSLPAAYLRRVFCDDAAEEWPTEFLGNLGNPVRGDAVQTGPFGAQLPSKEFVPEGIPVLNIGNVQWGRLDLSKLDHVTRQKAASLDRYRVRTGDLLFTRSGTVGRSAVVPPEADGWLMSYHLLRVALDQERVLPDFVAAAIRGCESVQAQVRRAAGRGATRDGVNTSILSALQVPLPPKLEQDRIIAGLKEKFRAVDVMLASIKQEIGEIEHLPAAILRRAFSGGL